MRSYISFQSWAKCVGTIYRRAAACRIRNITRQCVSALFSRLKRIDGAILALCAAIILTACIAVVAGGTGGGLGSILALAPILAVVGEDEPLQAEAKRRRVDLADQSAMAQLRRRLAREAEPRRLVHHFNLLAKPGEFVAVRCDDCEFAAKLVSAAKYDPYAGDSVPTIEIENPVVGPADPRHALSIPLASARPMREGEALPELSWAGVMGLNPTTRYEVAERAQRRRAEIVYYASRIGDALTALHDPSQGVEPLKLALYNLALLEAAACDIRRDLEDLRHARPIR